MSTDRKKEQQAAQDKATPGSDTNVPLTDTTKRELIAALKQNWQREMEGVRTYSDLARNERDATRRAVLVKMAEAEARHAQKWEQKLAELGAEPPKEERTLKMRFIPFFFLNGITAVIVAAIISLIAHFVVGAAKTLVTGRSWLSSGTEMTVVGAVEAVITYVLGAAFKAV